MACTSLHTVSPLLQSRHDQLCGLLHVPFLEHARNPWPGFRLDVVLAMLLFCAKDCRPTSAAASTDTWLLLAVSKLASGCIRCQPAA